MKLKNMLFFVKALFELALAVATTVLKFRLEYSHNFCHNKRK